MRWKPDISAIAALCAKRTKTCETRCGIKGHGTLGIRTYQETGELAGQRKVVVKADLDAIDLALCAAMRAPLETRRTVLPGHDFTRPFGELGR
ncbi:MAG: hypothetical protein V7695_02955 [Sulfitobacter sp.]